MSYLDIIKQELSENLDNTYDGIEALNVYMYIRNNTYDTVKVSDRVNKYTTIKQFLDFYLSCTCSELGLSQYLEESRCIPEVLGIIEELFIICQTTDGRWYVFAKFNQRNGKDIPEIVSSTKARVRARFIDEMLDSLG